MATGSWENNMRARHLFPFYNRPVYGDIAVDSNSVFSFWLANPFLQATSKNGA